MKLHKYHIISTTSCKTNVNFCKDWVRSSAKECTSCRSRKMMQNEYLLANIGVDTAGVDNLSINIGVDNLSQICSSAARPFLCRMNFRSRNKSSSQRSIKFYSRYDPNQISKVITSLLLCAVMWRTRIYVRRDTHFRMETPHYLTKTWNNVLLCRVDGFQ